MSTFRDVTPTCSEASWEAGQKLSYGDTRKMSDVLEPFVIDDYGFRPSSNPDSNGAIVLHCKIAGIRYAILPGAVDPKLVVRKDGIVSLKLAKVVVKGGKLLAAN